MTFRLWRCLGPNDLLRLFSPPYITTNLTQEGINFFATLPLSTEISSYLPKLHENLDTFNLKLDNTQKEGFICTK